MGIRSTKFNEKFSEKFSGKFSRKFNEMQRYASYLDCLFKIYLFFSIPGRELSFILLFGLIWCYSMTFVLLAPPSTYICALQRFGVSALNHWMVLLFPPVISSCSPSFSSIPCCCLRFSSVGQQYWWFGRLCITRSVTNSSNSLNSNRLVNSGSP